MFFLVYFLVLDPLGEPKIGSFQREVSSYEECLSVKRQLEFTYRPEVYIGGYCEERKGG